MKVHYDHDPLLEGLLIEFPLRRLAGRLRVQHRKCIHRGVVLLRRLERTSGIHRVARGRSERERQRERERARHTHTQTRKTHTDTHAHTHTDKEREGEKEGRVVPGSGKTNKHGAGFRLIIS